MPPTYSFAGLSRVLIILLLAVSTVVPDEAVVIIEDYKGEQVNIEGAFRQYRDAIAKGGFARENLNRLSQCFEGRNGQNVIEKLDNCGIQIVSGGSEDCPASNEGICDFVGSIKPFLEGGKALCVVEGLEHTSSSPLLGQAGDHVVEAAGASPSLPANVLEYPPNDKEFPGQETFFKALRIEETWKAVRESGLQREDVMVAIIDSGIAADHPDFKGKIEKGYDASGRRNKSLADVSAHGTAMAGIIGSNINNGIGIAGIADKVKLYPVRATRNRTRGMLTSEMIRAWEAALKFKKTQVILYAYGSPFKKAVSLIIKRLLEKAVKKGVFVVTVASNSDDFDGRQDVVVPCGLANGIRGVVCVAATFAEAPTVLRSNASKLASFGSPGSEVVCPTPNKVVGEWIYAKKKWGSSVASAAVAGVVALMKSFKNFKPEDIERMLLNATEGRVRTKTGYEMTYGVLRPDLAVKQAIAEAGLPQFRSSKWGRLIRSIHHWRGSRRQMVAT